MTALSGKDSGTLRERLIEDFEDEDFRRTYVEEFLDTSISAQIRALREQRGLSQGEFGKLIGTTQGGVSTFESTEYASWSISTLKKIAAALDLALVVRFASFGEVIDRIISFSRETLEKPSFVDDPTFKEEEPANTPPVQTTYPAEHFAWALVLPSIVGPGVTQRESTPIANMSRHSLSLAPATTVVIPPITMIVRKTHAENTCTG